MADPLAPDERQLLRGLATSATERDGVLSTTAQATLGELALRALGDSDRLVGHIAELDELTALTRDRIGEFEQARDALRAKTEELNDMLARLEAQDAERHAGPEQP